MEEEAEASGERKQQSHQRVGEGSRRVMRSRQGPPDLEMQQEWDEDHMGLALQVLLQDHSSLFRAAPHHRSSFLSGPFLLPLPSTSLQLSGK